MSFDPFRPWHPPHVPYGPKTPANRQSSQSTLATSHEDAQPNESINKRQQAPPSIHTTVPPRRVNSNGYRRREYVRSQPSGPSPNGHSNGQEDQRSNPSMLQNLNNNQTFGDSNRPPHPPHSSPSSSNAMPPPPKRRKLEYTRAPPHPSLSMPPSQSQTSQSSQPLQQPSQTSATALPAEVQVKQERSPSPEIIAVRRLVTCGSKHYKLPPQCKRGYPLYKQHRTEWAEREKKALSRLGLKVLKHLIREDGMSIDWESKRPVMNDTLQPPPSDIASAIERAHLANHHALEDVRSSQSRRKSREEASTPDGTQTRTEGHSAPSSSQASARIRRSASSDIEVISSQTARRPLNAPPSQRLSSASAMPPPPLPSQSSQSSSRPKPRPISRQPLTRTSPGHPTSSLHMNASYPTLTPTSHVLPTTLRTSTPNPSSPPAPPIIPPTAPPSSQVPKTTTAILPQPSNYRESSLPPIVYKTEPEAEPDGAFSQDELTVDELFGDSDPVSPKISSSHLAEQLPVGQLPPTRMPTEQPPTQMPTEQPPTLQAPAERRATERPPELHREYDNVSTDIGSADDWLSPEEEEFMTNAALQYIRRYITTFDEDRARLAGAYAEEATFSCKVHGDLATSLPRRIGRGKLVQGRLDVLSALRSFDSLKFCADGSADVQYDVVCLGKRTGVLLSVAATLRDARAGHSVRCSWSFVLRSNGSKASGGSKDVLWPLVATAHQMTLHPLPS